MHPPNIQTELPVRPRDVSMDYLLAAVTLLMLAHHSSLAYTTWAFYNPKHIFESTAPVVDSRRWAFLDYTENFNDVFFMSLMFFVSGLFVFPALRRHGVLTFLRDRFLRLGVPFLVTVTLWMPLAYYASWCLSGRNVAYLDLNIFHIEPSPRGDAAKCLPETKRRSLAKR